MPAQPFPDSRLLVEAILREARHVLDELTPKLDTFVKLRAAQLEVLQRGGQRDKNHAAYIEELEALSVRHRASPMPEIRLVRAHFTDEEWAVIRKSIREYDSSWQEAVKSSDDPAVHREAMERSTVPPFMELIVSAVRRVYMEAAAKLDRPPLPPNRDAEMEERDRFAYEQDVAGVDRGDIRREIIARGWDELSEGGFRGAIDAYADRHDLPRSRRQRGRPRGRPRGRKNSR